VDKKMLQIQVPYLHPQDSITELPVLGTIQHKNLGASLLARVLAFVGEIVDITAVLPLRHALVVMVSFVLSAHAMRIADEEPSQEV
jgi:hypothetical protein